MKPFFVLFAVMGLLLVQPAHADELRPGYLELRQTTPDTYGLLFKIPARGEDLRLAIYVKLPEGTQDVAPPRISFGEGAYVERRTIRRDGGLTGHAVSIDGLSATSTDIWFGSKAWPAPYRPSGCRRRRPRLSFKPRRAQEKWR